MKLLNHTAKRDGDRVTVTGDWLTQMRRPAGVKVTFGPLSEGAGGPQDIIAGDVKDVHGALFGLAEIAWNMGWRPPGLIAKAITAVTEHRILPEHKRK